MKTHIRPCVDCCTPVSFARQKNYGWPRLFRCAPCTVQRVVEVTDITLPAICAGCSRSYHRRHHGTRSSSPYCSANCRSRATAKGDDIADCERCGRQYTPSAYNFRHGKNRFCSTKCAAENFWSTNRKHASDADQIAHNRHKRQALFRGAKVEAFSKAEIFARDKWTCQLCHRFVDPDLKLPNVWCASLDHVIPLSKGGHHVVSNVQLAHWICNVRKRNFGKGLEAVPRPRRNRRKHPD